jgi:uncharacterized membrane protein
MKQEIERSVVVNAPLPDSYQQWSRSEDLPKFMEGLVEVRRVDDRHVRWKSQYGDQVVEAEAEILLEIPGRRIAWRTISGPESSGVVRFEMAEGGKTQVTLKMKFDPANHPGGDVQEFTHRLERNLMKFKELMESKGVVEEIVEKNWQGF